MKMQISAVTFVLNVVFLQAASGMSIDEMIVNAAKSVSDFDLIADLESGTVRLELDMMLLREQYKTLTDTSDRRRHRRKAYKNTEYRWPNKEIPYRIEPGVFSKEEHEKIIWAIDEWQSYTCLKFRDKTERDENFVNFNDGNGCYSSVGKVGGAQTIGLAGGCRDKGLIVHEIGHTVGFLHEQNRPDRDNHVTILEQNIRPDVLNNFNKYSMSAVDTFNVTYDYTSVMHYGEKAFSRNGQHTIKTVDEKYQKTIGNRDGLSFNDVKLANLMYSCCESPITCEEQDSFLGKDCKCWCRSENSPAKKCGSEDVTDTPGGSTKPASTSTTTMAPDCSDSNKNCPAWSESNFCKTNVYVMTYCKKSCDMCGGDESEKPMACRDKFSNCTTWRDHGYCDDTGYRQLMSDNCPQSCGHCSPEETTTTNSPGGSGANLGLVNCPTAFFAIMLITCLKLTLPDLMIDHVLSYP